MKKYIKFIAISSLAILLVACNSTENVETTEQPTENNSSIVGTNPANAPATMRPPDITQMPIVPDSEWNIELDEDGNIIPPWDEPIDLDLDNFGIEFFLHDYEIELYEDLKANLDISVLADRDPFTTAKIYIQAGIDSEWEVEWLLFHPDTIPAHMSRERFGLESQYEALMYSRASRQGMADLMFGFIEETGAAFDFGNGTAIITFVSVIDELDYQDALEAGIPEDELEAPEGIQFFLMQDENGIWRIPFAPLNPEWLAYFWER
ncbi:MAG: hypothetical protein FWD82_02275 [Defluviitaleaceae bacterium]|nr:hypothetical protein [Defluviitaleaceae bacterium]